MATRAPCTEIEATTFEVTATQTTIKIVAAELTTGATGIEYVLTSEGADALLSTPIRAGQEGDTVTITNLAKNTLYHLRMRLAERAARAHSHLLPQRLGGRRGRAHGGGRSRGRRHRHPRNDAERRRRRGHGGRGFACRRGDVGVPVCGLRGHHRGRRHRRRGLRHIGHVRVAERLRGGCSRTAQDRQRSGATGAGCRPPRPARPPRSSARSRD